MKWTSSQNAAQNARALLPKLADRYFRAGRKAASRDRPPKGLHRFRIATKRFRYTLELFQPVYGLSLDRRLNALRGLQESLGKVSDYQTIRRLVPDDNALDAKLKKAIRKHSKEFRRRWEALDSHGQLKLWKTYLARASSHSSGRPARRKRAASTGGN